MNNQVPTFCCRILAGVLLMAPLWAFSAADENNVTLLKEGDIVSVNVFNEGSLTGAFAVGPDGSIVFPLLGGVAAIGDSPDQLAAKIEQLLEKDYIRDAQVAVALAEVAVLPPKTITVIGQVTSPGSIPFKAEEKMDLFTAVAAAGGINERGNRNRIELKRREGSDIRTRTLSLEGDRVLRLEDGDTIIVYSMPIIIEEKEKIEMVTLIGEVASPGQLPMDPQRPLDLIGAIAISGGFTNTARRSKVIVRRNTTTGIQTFEVNVSKMQRDQSPPFMLAPNDTITVPESLF